MWNDMIVSNRFGRVYKEEHMGNLKMPRIFPGVGVGVTS
jgi:hypothetical protein